MISMIYAGHNDRVMFCELNHLMAILCLIYAKDDIRIHFAVMRLK